MSAVAQGSRTGNRFVESLRVLRTARKPDVAALVRTFEEMSAFAASRVDLKLAKRLDRELADFAWPPTAESERVRTLGHMRYLALLEGDFERAWLYGREAAVRANDPAHALEAETQAAVVGRLLGDERGAQIGFARASQFAKSKFVAGDANARIALATFAREIASDAPGEARKAMAAYESLAPRTARGADVEIERRARATGEMAHGRLAEIRGNDDAAYDRYRAALEGWVDVGDDLFAAIAATDVARLAHDPLAEETLDAVLTRAPKAWFAPSNSPANEILERITPAETLVLAALLGGKSARAIAHDLDRSVHTINNHTRKIFQAFGVTSRAAVLAHCAELGITAKSLSRIA